MINEKSISFINVANLKKILKECNITVPSNLKKENLAKVVIDYITQSRTNYISLCQRFKKELSVTPVELELILSCTRTERLRWCKEGKFKAVCKRTFAKYGIGKIECLCYDRLQVESITPEMVEQWHNEHKLEVTNSRKQGAVKAAITKKANKVIIDKFNKDLEVLYNHWKSKSEELYLTFKLAYWTSWINRWSKYYQLAASKASRRRRVLSSTKDNNYATLKDTFYDYKDQSLKLLSNSKYTNVSYYRPDEPDKYHFYLCEDHYEQWLMEREFEYIPLYMFYYTHQDEIDNCEDCISDVQEDYYSLYFIEISEPNEEYSFSFHVPYPIGSTYLPDPNTLKKVNHVENECSIFRFGRAINEDEMIIHRVKKVEKAFLDALSEYREFVNTVVL